MQRSARTLSLRQRLEGALALDEGRRVSVPLLLGVAVVAGASWLLFRGDLPWILSSGDAFEYAEMARRLSRGEGFTTGVVYPAELWLGADASHPAVKFPPGWPVLLSGVFRVAGPQEALDDHFSGKYELEELEPKFQYYVKRLKEPQD